MKDKVYDITTIVNNLIVTSWIYAIPVDFEAEMIFARLGGSGEGSVLKVDLPLITSLFYALFCLLFTIIYRGIDQFVVLHTGNIKLAVLIAVEIEITVHPSTMPLVLKLYFYSRENINCPSRYGVIEISLIFG